MIAPKNSNTSIKQSQFKYEIMLPSNRKFGFFFTFIFGLSAAYFYKNNPMLLSYIMAIVSFVLFIVTVIKADFLLPLNKFWMRFGLLLGMVISPIVLGIIFFGLFTPIAIIMRLSGRDELQLKFIKKPNHWISRNEPIKSESFKHQF
jgi:hypothetical protein